MKALDKLIAKKGKRFSKKDVDDFYKSYTWQKCRGTTLERDGYLCQVCLRGNIPTPADTVHHIVHLRDDPTLALEDTNLISVCRDCHETLHSDRGNQDEANKETSNKIQVININKNPNIIR